MDTIRKKELLEAYRNRRPEMGVISLRCIQTGQEFFGISTDIQADFNSNRCKLSTCTHPNKKMQALWDVYGEDGFAFTVAAVLKYKNVDDNHTEKLEALRTSCMEQNSQAERIWR